MPEEEEQKPEKPEGLNINITTVNVFVHITISDAEGNVITDFHLNPYDALGISTSLQDSAIIARINGITALRQSGDEKNIADT